MCRRRTQCHYCIVLHTCWQRSVLCVSPTQFVQNTPSTHNDAQTHTVNTRKQLNRAHYCNNNVCGVYNYCIMLAATTTRRVSRHIVLVRACAIVQRKPIHHAFMSYELHISAYDDGGGALTYLTGRVRRTARSSPPNLNALALSKALRLHTHKHTHILHFTHVAILSVFVVCFFICMCAFGCGTNRGFMQSAHVL